MVDTFYLHLEFLTKNSWSINLPFLCTMCGNCCKLEDFLSAGKIEEAAEDFLGISKILEDLYRELGKIWDLNETKYDEELSHRMCPFLKDNFCSIYEIRPKGCRVFPRTVFGMDSQDCEPLTRFKKMRSTLKKGRKSRETFCFVDTGKGPAEASKPHFVKIDEEQFQNCLVKLRKAGMTDDELELLKFLNGRS